MKMSNRMLCVLGADDCTILFTGYQEKRKNGVSWYSPPYYTHSHGYEMGVFVWMQPTQTGLHVFSCLLPGEYDAGLKCPSEGQRWYSYSTSSQMTTTMTSH